jgi:hypothetical protein
MATTFQEFRGTLQPTLKSNVHGVVNQWKYFECRAGMLEVAVNIMLQGDRSRPNSVTPTNL